MNAVFALVNVVLVTYEKGWSGTEEGMAGVLQSIIREYIENIIIFIISIESQVTLYCYVSILNQSANRMTFLRKLNQKPNYQSHFFVI